MKVSGIVLSLLLLSVSIFASNAQERPFSAKTGWGASVPVGGGNFVGKTGWMNPSAEWEWRFASHFSGGVSVGYLFTKEEDGKPRRIGGDVVSDYEIKQSLVPIEAVLRYYPLGRTQSMLRPYVVASGGAAYSNSYVTGSATSTSEQAGWGGTFSAGLGTRVYPFPAGSFFLDFAAAWRWTGTDLTKMNIDSHRRSSADIRLGVGFDF